MTKKAIKLDVSTNYLDRQSVCTGLGIAQYDPDAESFFINTNFANPKGKDDYMTISFNIKELMRVIGEVITDPIDY